MDILIGFDVSFLFSLSLSLFALFLWLALINYYYYNTEFDFNFQCVSIHYSIFFFWTNHHFFIWLTTDLIWTLNVIQYIFMTIDWLLVTFSFCLPPPTPRPRFRFELYISFNMIFIWSSSLFLKFFSPHFYAFSSILFIYVYKNSVKSIDFDVFSIHLSFCFSCFLLMWFCSCIALINISSL